MGKDSEWVTPGEALGKTSKFKAGRGAYVSLGKLTIYAYLTGLRRIVSLPPDIADQRATVEVPGQKAHGAIPEPGSLVIARIRAHQQDDYFAQFTCFDYEADCWTDSFM